MRLTFNRSQTVLVKMQKPESIRAFVFDLEVAVAKSTDPVVDPMSGMLLNLLVVDKILADLRALLPVVNTFQSLLQYCNDFISSGLQTENCSLSSLILREKRGFWFGLKSGALVMGDEYIREWNGGLWRFVTETSFNEEDCGNQPFQLANDAVSIMQCNALQRLVLEDLGSGEKTEIYI